MSTLLCPSLYMYHNIVYIQTDIIRVVSTIQFIDSNLESKEAIFLLPRKRQVCFVLLCFCFCFFVFVIQNHEKS